LKRGTGNELFEPVMHSSSRFLRMDIWLYRVHNGAAARPWRRCRYRTARASERV